MEQSIFDVVKANVDMKAVASMYGLKINRSGMCSCPFHRHDKHPSMKIYPTRYHYFACGEGGDIFDFVMKFFGVTSSLDAAQKIAEDFRLDVETEKKKPRPQKPVYHTRDEKEAIKDFIRIWIDYFWRLKEWKAQYAPLPFDKELHPLFVLANKEIAKTEDFLDNILDPTLKDDELLSVMKEYSSKTEKIAFLAHKVPKLNESPEKGRCVV